MPDNEKILFGAEFKSEGFNSGVDDIISKMEGLKGTQKDLQKGIAAFTTSLKVGEDQIKNTEKEIRSLDKSSKDYSLTLDTLNKKLVGLRADQQIVSQGLTESRKELDAVSKVTKDYEKNLSSFSTKQGEVAKQWEKLINVQGYAADGIKKVKNYVAELSVGLVSGLAAGLAAIVIPKLVEFAENILKGGEATRKLREQHELATEVFKKASEAVGGEVAKLELYRIKLNDTNIPANERVRIAKEYNKTAERTNQIDTTQIDNLVEINKQITKQNALIIQRAVSLAATAKLADPAAEFVSAQLQVSEALKKSGLSEEEALKRTKFLLAERKKVVDQFANTTDISKPGQSRSDLSDQQTAIDAQIGAILGDADALDKGGFFDLIELRNKAKKNLDETAAFLSTLIDPNALTKHETGPGKAAIENVFLEKLRELRARLASLSSSEFQSEGLIRNKFVALLDKEFGEIGKLLKEKKLTGPQAGILKGILQQINDVSLEKELTDFRKKQADALRGVDDLISTTAIEAGQKRVANIRDEFERESATIEQGFEATTAALNKRLRDALKKVQDDVDKGLIKPGEGQQRSLLLTAVFGDLLTQAGVDRTNRQLDLAFKSFQRTIQESRRIFEGQALVLSEETTAKIQAETDKFVKGAETYKTYQENLTKILRKEADERRKIQLAEAVEDLRRINQMIGTNTDEGIGRQLEQQQRAARATIAQLSRDIAEGDSKEDEDARKKKTENIIHYAESINGLLTSILNFWNEVNKVEEESLNRSIALQQKRVDNAKDIAEKGNAEYLEQEQKRLDELERRREENARKQLAINNALTVSNALVAAISAIAQAVSTGSPFAAFAAVAAVIGAIAAGYAFVNSLQPQSASFFEGVESVDDIGRPAGIDTVPARLHKKERVVTAEKNEKYWDTLHAIHNGSIPPGVLNAFVNSYPTVNIPAIDFGRLSEATAGKVGADSLEVARKIDATNEKLDDVVQAISTLGIGVNIDEEGFALGMGRYQRKQKLRRRS